MTRTTDHRRLVSLTIAVTVGILGTGCGAGRPAATETANLEETAKGGTRPAAANLDGTYRHEITLDEARDADMLDTEDGPYPHIITVELDDGRFSMNDGNLTGTYTIDGNQLTFDVAEFGAELTFTFSLDEAGNLHLTPVQPMDPGDAFVFSSDPWTKLE